MRVLITGGAGFIGSHLAARYIEQGDHVTVIDDLSTGSYDNIVQLMNLPNFNFAIETILNETVMDRLVSECSLIVHLAAAVGVELVIGDPVHTIETNVLGTYVVLKTANRYRKKVILISTSEIYGEGVNESFKEDDFRLLGPITQSRWSYSCTKELDEFLGLAYFKQKELPIVICRLFNTIGPRQTGHYGMVVPRFVNQALNGEPVTVYGDGSQSRCFCNVNDVLDGINIISTAPKAEGEVYNLGSHEEITITDLARKVIEVTGSSSEIVYIPYEQAYTEGFSDMKRRKPDIRKMIETFQWQPRYTLEETLSLIVEYELQLRAETLSTSSQGST
ncbi:GDP-mannose 4,6-dehydratase [Chloroflexota bacterium]